MIGLLKGIILEKSPPEILIDVNGVGYEVLLPMTSFYNLPEIGQSATIYIHFVVREDAHLLFGFWQKSDRTLFRELIKTNGVGPKMALAILSSMSVDEFVYCINNEKLTNLVKIPGVGKKTAERLIVELKGKFDKSSSAKFFVTAGDIDLNSASQSPLDEAFSALEALGYKAPDINKMLKSLDVKNLTAEDLIRAALKKTL